MTTETRDPSPAFELVMDAYADALEGAGISSLTIGSDDYGMETAEDSDLMDWADDSEARLGLNVEGFRAALVSFIASRA